MFQWIKIKKVVGVAAAFTIVFTIMYLNGVGQTTFEKITKISKVLVHGSVK